MSSAELDFLETIFNEPDISTRFRFREPVATAAIPLEHLSDSGLPEFVGSIAAFGQLISEARFTTGSCHYGGWIDQAVFTVRRSSGSHPAMLRDLLPSLASDPIEQTGDAMICFLSHDRKLVSVVEVSREKRLVQIAHYCDDTTTQARLLWNR